MKTNASDEREYPTNRCDAHGGDCDHVFLAKSALILDLDSSEGDEADAPSHVKVAVSVRSDQRCCYEVMVQHVE